MLKGATFQLSLVVRDTTLFFAVREGKLPAEDDGVADPADAAQYDPLHLPLGTRHGERNKSARKLHLADSTLFLLLSVHSSYRKKIKSCTLRL